eukprot:jgi/Botrbrau1/19595/Bobra.0035s0073.1
MSDVLYEVVPHPILQTLFVNVDLDCAALERCGASTKGVRR